MAIVRKDRLSAGYNGNLESVIVTTDGQNKLVKDAQGNVTNGKVITNGLFVHLGKLMEGEREVRQATLGSDHTKEIVLIHNGEVMYDERLYRVEDYKIDAGKVARAYHLYEGDILTLTDDLFADATVVNGVVTVRPTYVQGDKLMIKANGLLGKVVTAGDEADARIWFEVLEDAGNELHISMKAFALAVHRN